jgi:hypothetical protein
LEIIFKMGIKPVDSAIKIKINQKQKARFQFMIK